MLHRDSFGPNDFIEPDGCEEQLSTMLKVFVPVLPGGVPPVIEHEFSP
jgi:hypothetical protein